MCEWPVGSCRMFDAQRDLWDVKVGELRRKPEPSSAAPLSEAPAPSESKPSRKRSSAEDLQRMSNAAIKKARQAATLPTGLDEVLSLLNARLRRIEGDTAADEVTR